MRYSVWEREREICDMLNRTQITPWETMKCVKTDRDRKEHTEEQSDTVYILLTVRSAGNRNVPRTDAPSSVPREWHTTQSNNEYKEWCLHRWSPELCVHRWSIDNFSTGFIEHHRTNIIKQNRLFFFYLIVGEQITYGTDGGDTGCRNQYIDSREILTHITDD